MRRTVCAFAACCTVMLGLSAAPAAAAEPKAAVTGDLDRSLRKQLEVAIGEVKTAADSRVEARRRARDAAQSALDLLRSEGYYDGQAEPGVSETEPPRATVQVTPGARFVFRGAAVAWGGGG
ncbi:MAG: hypothetical protein ACR2FH_00345 [Caulobacteraceae bacterium]